MNNDEIKKEIRELVIKYFENLKAQSQLLPVHYGASFHDENEATAIIEAVLDGWWTYGKRSEEFERAFKEYFNAEYAIFCNSGSSALVMAFESLNLPKGSGIITPALSFPTSINPAIRQQMDITLVDSDVETYNMSTDALEEAVTKDAKAIILPHIMGNMADMDKVMEIVEKNNLILIEDSCEAIGSKFGNKLLGTFGISATFSFFPSHHISAGGGGMIITNDKNIYLNSMSLKHWGRQYTDVKHIPSQSIIRSDYVQQYTYETLGYNFIAGELMAANGIVQMKKLEHFNKARQENFEILFNFFKKYDDIFILPATVNSKAEPSWFAFPLTIRENAKFVRNDLMDFLFKKKIEARHVLGGNLAKQPAYSGVKFKTIGNLEGTDLISKNSFFIGIYAGITKERMDYMQECFAEFIAANG